MNRIFKEPATLPKGRVLVADDDASIRAFVGRALTAHGYDSESADDGEQALDRLRADPFDVALVDLDMPKRDGLELLGAILADKIDVVPVLMTGTRDVPSAITAMKRGAYDYLPKPIESEMLKWIVERSLQEARSRRRERGLQEVVGEWAATFDACPDLMLAVDGQGRVLRANRATGEFLGRHFEKIRDCVITDLFPPALAAKIDATLHNPESRPQARIVESGAEKHFLLSVNPIPPRHGRVVILRDITDIVAAEQRQRQTYGRMLNAREDERRHIARELHDGVAQSVATLMLGLTQSADAAAPGNERQRLRLLQKIAGDTLAELRRLAHGLRPPVLDELGLVAALGRLVESTARVHHLKIDLLIPVPLEERLPAALELATFRIVQESLQNVVKHSGATAVDVVLEATESKLNLSIADNGRGLDHDADGRGIGLADMRERVAMLDGTLRLETPPSGGTVVIAQYPIPAGEDGS